jgi:hypothetical protein
MLPNQTISRRTLLRGLGTAIALPMLDAMVPRLAIAKLNAPKAKLPIRMAFIYVPNGKNMKHWTPDHEGRDYKLTSTLEPLAEFKNDFSILTGLTCDKARANGDGAGDHARAMSAFLTGCQPKKTSGADIRAGVSVDQFAAQRVGGETRFPSLEIGCEGGRQAGNCDSGYSCAYSSTISWRGESTPVPKETSPQLLFDRFFGQGSNGDQESARAKREKYNKSILDLVRDDAKRLEKSLGTSDRRKLDEYLSAIRELETRIAIGSKALEPSKVDYVRPEKEVTKKPADYPTHIQLLSDLMVLAFRTDQTRIATFVFANEGSQRTYPFAGVSEGHHDLSHHQNNPQKLEKLRKINEFHVKQLAYLLKRLKESSDGEQSLLDQTMLVYGSGNSDGNRHNHDDLPILLAGRAGGTLTPGRHIRVGKETPITNLFVEMLNRLDIKVERFGDSTGRLPGLRV